MSNLTYSKLEQDCRAIESCVDSSIQWVQSNKTLVPTENQKEIIFQLKKHRRNTIRYRKALNKRPAVTIFGQSQVGKSYLVSNLAIEPGQSYLKIIEPATNGMIDFIKEMNPKGGGAEATGLVSRFTVVNNYQVGKQPFVLKLLTQADIVKIICNGYLSDINNYQYNVDREYVIRTLADARKKMQSGVQPGFSEDEVYEMVEYLQYCFNDSHIIKDLDRMNFWEAAVEIIPYLPNENRVQLLEIIWGRREFFTDYFSSIAAALKEIGFALEVRTNKESLSPQENTILDVQRLNEYFDANNKNKTIKVWLENGQCLDMNRSLMSAATAELVLLLPQELANHKDREFLQHADILDFPGARSRKKIPEETFLSNTDKEKLEIFLRGKIAFLFDRFTYEQDISSLIFCMDDKQSEVQDLPRLIYEWIKTTFGASQAERTASEDRLQQIIGNMNKEVNPLLVVFTKFNIEIAGSPSDTLGDPSSHNEKWKARFQRNFHDFMLANVSDKWLEKWTNEQPIFKNLFLLRDPKYSKHTFLGINADNSGVETKVHPDAEQRVKDMTSSFMNHPYVNKHFRNPKENWEEAVSPTKSGIDLIERYLRPTCNPAIRLERLKLLIEHQKLGVLNVLKDFVENGNIEQLLEDANMKGAEVFLFMNNWVAETSGFGYFLDKIKLQEEEANSLYFNFKTGAFVGEKQEETPVDNKRLINLKQAFKSYGISFDESKSEEENLEAMKLKLKIPIEKIKDLLKKIGITFNATGNLDKKVESEAEQFSQKVLSFWQSKLARVKDGVLLELGLTKEVANYIYESLDKSKRRVKLKNIIKERIESEVRSFTVSNNYDIVAHISSLAVNDFVSTVGWTYIDEKEKDYPTIDDIPVFSKAPIKTPNKQKLETNMPYPGMNFFTHWLEGMRASFAANVLYEANFKNAEDAIAKQKLNEILKPIMV